MKAWIWVLEYVSRGIVRNILEIENNKLLSFKYLNYVRSVHTQLDFALCQAKVYGAIMCAIASTVMKF